MKIKRFHGYTRSELYKMTLPELKQIAQSIELETGKPVDFKYFHFLKKCDAIALIQEGDNRKPKCQKIMQKKVDQMLGLKDQQVAGIKEFRVQSKERKEKSFDRLGKQLSKLIDYDEAGHPLFHRVPDNMKRQAKKWYEQNK